MQLFYYLNERLPLTNGLLIVPDGEGPDGEEKITLKNLYEIFKDTPSHGLVSLQFLSALGIFFGLDINTPKMPITELYRNLSFGSLSGVRDFSFDSVSDLTLGKNFKIKGLTPSNRDGQEKEDEISLEKINEDTTFVELLDQFEEDLIYNLFRDLEHKKIEHPYVEPQVQDAAIIETEKENTYDKFFGLQHMLNEVSDAATKQEKQNVVITLFSHILDEDNPFNNIKTGDIYIEGNLFDNKDSQNIKNNSNDVIETIDLSDNIEISSATDLATDAPKK